MSYRSRIWNRNRVSCVVMMIKAEEKDKAELSRLFEAANSVNTARFISWEDWSTLVIKRQNTIINNQVKYHDKYSSLIISDFHDDNNTTMGQGLDDAAIPPEQLLPSRMTVNEYLQTQFMIIRDNSITNIASFIYPPINGMREIIVDKNVLQLAIQWSKVVKCDLFRNMSPLARTNTFKDVAKMEQLSNATPPWAPNKLDAHFLEAEIMTTEGSRGKKRNKALVHPSSTYANITAGAAATATAPPATLHQYPAFATNNTVLHEVAQLSPDQKAIIDDLQQKFIDMEGRQIAQDTRIETIEKDVKQTIGEVKTVSALAVKTQATIETSDLNLKTTLDNMSRQSDEQFKRLEAIMLGKYANPSPAPESATPVQAIPAPALPAAAIVLAPATAFGVPDNKRKEIAPSTAKENDMAIDPMRVTASDGKVLSI